MVNQEEPEEITDETDPYPLIRHREEDQAVDVANGPLLVHRAEKEEHRDREYHLVEKGMVMGYLPHQAPLDEDRGGRPENGRHERQRIAQEGAQGGKPGMFAQEEDHSSKGQD